ncbi:uncharacterized protein [Nicotiana tomentosiformis]|uniref:uncharacterized protein n=1 Tax=Nicotiana tomentosiformis TaxID=4098 RepID=UPI00388CB46C
MPFPEKWNMNPVARMPEPIPELKQWVEGLVLQRPYSDHSWMELSKGRWESHSHGLGKDDAMRPSSADEEFPAPKQAKEKKRKEAPSSPEHEADLRSLTENSDTYKLVSEKHRADLATTQNEDAEIAEQVFRVLHDTEDELEITNNDLIMQARQSLEKIGRLQTQVDAIQAEAEEFKKNMDILASKKEIVQAQLESVETHLRAAKEKVSVQIKECQHQLDLDVSDKASLAGGLEVSRSEMTETNKRVEDKVAQFRVDVEVKQAKAKGMVEHAKWQARREALEEVSAQGFDIVAETENAKSGGSQGPKAGFP